MNYGRFQKIGITLIVFFLIVSQNFVSHADIQLGSPFGSNMVIQRDTPVSIWGWSDAGDEISVFARDQKVTAKADSDGRWKTTLQPLAVGDPFSIRVVGSRNEIELENVVAGEVWICSGQSNMEWTVRGAANPERERLAADYPLIRHLKIQHAINTIPQTKCKTSDWQICSPQTAPNFTAVGYYFGRKLHQELNVPVGLVNTTWGGTIIEAWTSAESLETRSEFQEFIARTRESSLNLEQAKRQFEIDITAWRKKYDQAIQKGLELAMDVEGDLVEWKAIQVPGHWEYQGLEGYDGMAWYRKSVDLPERMMGKKLSLSLAKIDDNDKTFVNGQLVGQTFGWNKPRQYTLPEELTNGSKLAIAVQVTDIGQSGGVHGQPNKVALVAEGEEPISLAGEWQIRKAQRVNELPPRPQPVGFDGPNHPTALFNAMVNPLIPFTHKGVIWYQGESNVGRASQYRELFPLLIQDWRSKWNRDFPFYWVQLANFRKAMDVPVASQWALLREAQSMTQSTPKTGQAVIIDIGEAHDIHPKNKQEVGRRLALIALKNDYGFGLDCYGPNYKAMKVNGAEIRIQFDYSEGLKPSDGQPLKRFEIAGSDRKFVWAQARIDGQEVVVTSPQVKKPIAVRYAWADNPDGCNLTNHTNLPACPFRTDDYGD